MSPDEASLRDLRRLSTEELVQLGEDSLKRRLLEQAVWAHIKHGRLTAQNLAAFLQDNDCVRYPTRLVFELGEMAAHQFAHPGLDWRCPDENGRVLYLRPLLSGRPELVPLAVAYMIPVVNYGSIIRDEHCLLYGATLLGLMQEEFYAQICALADLVQAEVRFGELTQNNFERS